MPRIRPYKSVSRIPTDMAAALIDRLLHDCHIVNIRGNSYRMRAHQDLLRTAHEERHQESGP